MINGGNYVRKWLWWTTAVNWTRSIPVAMRLKVSFFSFSYSIPLDDRERVYRERPCNCLYDRCAMEKRAWERLASPQMGHRCLRFAIYRATRVNTVAHCLLASPVVLSTGKLSLRFPHSLPSSLPRYSRIVIGSIGLNRNFSWIRLSNTYSMGVLQSRINRILL